MHDAGTVDGDLRLVFSVHGVEVGRQVIIELHAHDDPEETRQLRHRETIGMGAHLPRISRA